MGSVAKQAITDQNEITASKIFFKNLQLAGFPLSPIFSVYPLLLCLKFVNVEFLSLLPHEGVLAVDLLHHSNSHVALIMAWQIEVISSGFSFTFPQQIERDSG